jgi:erythritol kinase
MTTLPADLIVAIDAGTSVIKAVAFDLAGRQVALASVPNSYRVAPDGTATQDMARAWTDAVQTLRLLADRVPGLPARTAVLAVTGQGDGTWLVDRENRPVGEAWLWLDGRANAIVDDWRASDADAERYRITGTGLASGQQGPQLLWLDHHQPEALAAADAALHCKDWLYLNLTGTRATDPCEATFTFGDFRIRNYSDDVVEILGLSRYRRLLPPILDGTRIHEPLTGVAAAATGLLEGTPVVLGYIDVICTAMGAGIFDPAKAAGVTIVGSTGMHMRAVPTPEVALNADRTGYVMLLPVDGHVSQMQSNMASTLNVDWLLKVVAEMAASFGNPVEPRSLLPRLEEWIGQGQPGRLIYQPYISEAGERGPFINGRARAGFIGLSSLHGFADLARAIVESLGFAACDCYGATGGIPPVVRLSGGAVRSPSLRGIMSACLGTPVQTSAREEAGAAGAAMIAAVATGHYAGMAECCAEWVSPLLGAEEPPDPALARQYRGLYPAYVAARRALPPVWQALAAREAP